MVTGAGEEGTAGAAAGSGVRGPAGRGGAAAVAESLARVVTSEVRLLEDLIGILRRQREALAASDLQAVDDCIFATHRVLRTLGEAQRHRATLNQMLGAPAELPLRAAEALLGAAMTDALRFACEGLHAAAMTLAREVEVSRMVLRWALLESPAPAPGPPAGRALLAVAPALVLQPGF